MAAGVPTRGTRAGGPHGSGCRRRRLRGLRLAAGEHRLVVPPRLALMGSIRRDLRLQAPAGQCPSRLVPLTSAC